MTSPFDASPGDEGGSFGRVWAGWRLAPLEGRSADGQPEIRPLRAEPGLSLFETIDRCGLPDDETYVLWRGERSFALLNVYPYTSGHLMVLPRRAVPELEDLDEAEYAELWSAVRCAVRAVKAAFNPHGMNVGLNLGTAGGGSVPDHLHVHVVPRWSADTNFMTTVAEVRVLPQALSDTWTRLREAWLC